MEMAARFLGHDTRKVAPVHLELRQPIQALGLEVHINLRDVFREVPALGKGQARARKEWPVPHARASWAFVAVSLGHEAGSRSFTTFLEEVVVEAGALPEGRLPRCIPIGACAIFPVRPRQAQGWPVTIAAAKRHMYQHWLPASASQLAGVIDDFEYHDERSLRPRNPEIELSVAIQPRLAQPESGGGRDKATLQPKVG